MTNLVSGEEALEKFGIDGHVGPSERGGGGCKGLVGVHVEISDRVERNCKHNRKEI